MPLKFILVDLLICYDLGHMKVEVITFDLDGVYFVNGKGKFIESLKRLGVNEEESLRVFLRSSQMNQEYKNGRMTDEEFWSWAIDQWRLNWDWQRIVDLLIEGYEVDREVAGIVRELRNKGYKTAICSNNFPARIAGLQKKFGFLNDFDVVVLSYEVGMSKPDKRIFEELVRKSKAEPEEIIFADDNEMNLAGAREVGITTFVYEGFDKYLEQLKGLGVKL